MFQRAPSLLMRITYAMGSWIGSACAAEGYNEHTCILARATTIAVQLRQQESYEFSLGLLYTTASNIAPC